MNLVTCLKSYIAVVNTQSFTAASRELSIHSKKLSNQITWLEKYFHTKLLIRSTRRLVLTEAGKILYEKSIKLISEIDELKADVLRQRNNPEGWIRVCMTVTPAVPYLTSLSLEFMRSYPKIQVYIIVGSEIIGINENQYDVVISFDPITHPQLVCKKLFSVRRALFASPEYLQKNNEPTRVDELADHNCLINTLYSSHNKWILNKHVIQVSGSFKSNNGNVLKQAAVEGAGIIWVPPFTVYEEVRKGLLKQILVNELSPEIALYAIYSRFLSDNNKITLLLNHYREHAVQDGFGFI